MKQRIIFISVLIALVACQKGLEPIESPTISSEQAAYSAPQDLFISQCEEAVIGERIPNPLSIENMRKAFSNLPEATKSGFSENDLVPTHHYIAFTPSNEDELYAVKGIKEEEMLIFHYPLDYEVSDGLITPDSRFMVNGYSYVWAYVPIDYDLSKISCPYIYYYDIYSPEYDAPITKSQKALPMNLREELEKASYAMCGLSITPVIQTKAGVHPSGYIKFWDLDSNSYKGVDGFKVRAVRGLHSCFMNTDATGYFTTDDTFQYAFQYEVYFRRTDFEIRKNDTTSEIILKYSNYTGPINLNYSDDDLCFYAAIDRAAIVYYYLNNCGLRRPPMESDNTARLAIQAIVDEDDPDVYGLFYINNRVILSERPKIHIYKKSDNARRANIDIFATTVHELAHASHWRGNKTTFNATDNQVIESFARGVQWIITSAYYPGYVVPFYARQSYTGIVQDLIDGTGTKESNISATWVNGTLQYSYSYKSYYDHVTGFTPAQIEEAVRISKTWNEWQYNIRVNNPGITSSVYLSDAFNYWNSQN